jgi:MscS family membrane protein
LIFDGARLILTLALIPTLAKMKMKKFALLFLILVAATSCLGAQSVTSLLGGASAKNAAAASTDSLGRQTPSGTVLGFLQAAQSEDYQAAADYLQMSAARRQSQGADAATKLKTLMDAAFVGSLRRVSNNPEGDPDAGGPDEQTIGVFSIASEGADSDIPVVLVRVTDPNAGKIWLFSSGTLSKVPDLYDTVEAHRVETRLPQSLVKHAWLGTPLWQWLALLAAIPVAIIAGWVIVLFLAIPRRLYLKFRKRPDLHSYRRVSMPLLLCFSAIAHRVIAHYFGLPLLTRFYYGRTMGVLVCIGMFWFLLRVTSVTMHRLRAHAIGIGRRGTGTLIVLGERLLSALVVVIGVLAVLGILGFDLTTVLAGLGIGGIAIAFAAQKTLENLFGGISVLADEVIRVGDYCRFGDKTGTVEDISLRSTRVRTDARTELSIPNGTLATMSIENYTRRDKIIFNPVLAIRCETTGDQLRYLLAEIRRLLYQHPKVEPESAGIRFANVDPSSLRLEVSAYVLTIDANEYTAIREDLLFRISEIVGRSGTGFAFPSQTLYMTRDHGLDQERAAAAEKQVDEWRDQNQLPFPDFAPADKASFRGSIPYPPPESATAKKRS